MMSVNGVQVAALPEPTTPPRRNPDDAFASELDRVLNEAKNRPDGPQPKKFDLDTPGRDEQKTREKRESKIHESAPRGVQDSRAAQRSKSEVAGTGAGTDAGASGASGGVDGTGGDDKLVDAPAVEAKADVTEDGAPVDADAEASIADAAALAAAQAQGINPADGDSKAAVETTATDARSAEAVAQKGAPAGAMAANDAAAVAAAGAASERPEAGSDDVPGNTIDTTMIDDGADSKAPSAANTRAVEGAAALSAAEAMSGDTDLAAATGETSPDGIASGDAGADALKSTKPQSATAAPVAASPAQVDVAAVNAAQRVSPQQAAAAAAEPTTSAQSTGFDMSRLGEGIAGRIRTSDKVQTLSLQLHPAELGGVRIEVRQVEGVTHMVLTPDNPSGGQRLAAALADLRHDLDRAGVNIGDLQLRQDTSGSQHGRSGDGRGAGDAVHAGQGPRASVPAAVAPTAKPQSVTSSGAPLRVAMDL